MADTFLETALGDADADIQAATATPCTEFEVTNDLASAGSAAVRIPGVHPAETYEVLAPGESKSWKGQSITQVIAKRKTAGVAATVRHGPVHLAI